MDQQQDHQRQGQPDEAAANSRAGKILIHPSDDVVVVLVETANGIPPGHKMARRRIQAGQAVIKYGSPIGLASQDIEPGEWVHTHNLATALTEHWQPAASPQQPDQECRQQPASTAAFAGYRRPDGQVGIRNDIWILPTVGCVNKTAEKLAAFGQGQVDSGRWCGIDAVQALTHPLGCSQLGDDHKRTVQILASLARHPNAAAVLVISLGCENNQLDAFHAVLGDVDPKRMAFLIVQETADEIAAGQAILEQLAVLASQEKRTPCPLTDLVIGLKCGGSDAWSGITANPLLGRLTDRILAGGGSALLTEIPEFFGAEQVLLQRTAESAARKAFIDLINDVRNDYARHGVPVYENPSPGNKAGGITTLEEKSLGCIQKAGNRPVTEIVRYGMRRTRPGLAVVEGPGNDMIAITALAAAGSQLILFTTGRGNPLGGPVPTLKISSNTALARKKPHWIDFDAGPALEGETMCCSLDDALLDLVLRTASGLWLARNETAGYREIALFKNGVTL